MDLPIGDPGAGAAEYADVVCRSISDLGSGVVLVGHSMGGLVIPLVASRRPVAMLVFLCAAVPEPGRSHWQVKREEPGESPGPGAAEIWGQPGDRHLASRETAREMFYNDCPLPLQEWALDRLRPQCRRPLSEVTPLKEWPPVPLSLINATDDRCIPTPVAVHNAWRLFKRTPHFIPGGHLPFLARPELVADVLTEVTARGVASTERHDA